MDASSISSSSNQKEIEVDDDSFDDDYEDLDVGADDEVAVVSKHFDMDNKKNLKNKNFQFDKNWGTFKKGQTIQSFQEENLFDTQKTSIPLHFSLLISFFYSVFH
jgi:hypothetical protein